MTVRDVADAFAVHPSTVRSWAAHSRIRTLRTPTGQLRFRASDVADLLHVDAPAVASDGGEDAEPSESVSHPTHRGASHAHPTT